MSSRRSRIKVAKFSFEGPDKKGIIATITGFFFSQNCNILDIDQRIWDGYLIMNMMVDCSDQKRAWPDFIKVLEDVVYSQLGMKYRIVECEACRPKNMALLVTKENHCAQAILELVKADKINGQVKVVVGNHDELKSWTQMQKIPFHFVPSEKKREHETQVLKILDDHEIDVVVLARYMQILSPDFVFRHEGRIINIHPSLLPAFPGPRSYHQAFNKGVDFIGVTAHFVTTDLDEGPIICQDAFRVNKEKDTVENYIQKGRALEAKVLAKAVQLFCADKLSLRRGKVMVGKKEHDMDQKSKGFYL